MTLAKFISWLTKKGLTLAVAESCTGGLICHKLTAIPGASKVFKEGTICYSDASKTKRLGIGKAVIERHGAVSPEVCRLMAKNITASEKTDLGISVTGIAGPSGLIASRRSIAAHPGAALRPAPLSLKRGEGEPRQRREPPAISPAEAGFGQRLWRGVGVVYIGINIKGKVTVHKYNFRGTRNNIQEQAAQESLRLLERKIR
ncbi:MAG: CinA family protein [Planctomycetota bacterium]